MTGASGAGPEPTGPDAVRPTAHAPASRSGHGPGGA